MTTRTVPFTSWKLDPAKRDTFSGFLDTLELRILLQLFRWQQWHRMELRDIFNNLSAEIRLSRKPTWEVSNSRQILQVAVRESDGIVAELAVVAVVLRHYLEKRNDRLWILEADEESFGTISGFQGGSGKVVLVSYDHYYNRIAFWLAC
jgi:hypothetical protein